MIREITDKLTPVYGRNEGRAIACIIAEEATGLSMEKILTKGLKLKDVPKALKMMSRALTCEPIQHITGWTMFCGNRIKCDRRALIPRPETEEMVEWILENEKDEGLKIIDIGTGSGCIATVLARKGWEVTAMEKSDEAAELAQDNFSANNVKVRLVHDDILSPACEYDAFDMIVSNPPYIKPSESSLMEKNVLAYEPEMALFATEEDPLMFYKAISEFGKEHLKDGGRIYVEINRELGEETADVFRSAGYKDVDVRSDMFNNERFISGKWIK